MIINNREISIVQYNTETNWIDEIPNNKWLCILVDNDRDRRYIDEVNSKIIDKNVCYVCTIGQQCELNHDLLDEELVIRDVENGYLPSHITMTTWHDDFDEGIWFALNAAVHEKVQIEKVVIIDMTAGIENKRIDKSLRQKE